MGNLQTKIEEIEKEISRLFAKVKDFQAESQKVMNRDLGATVCMNAVCILFSIALSFVLIRAQASTFDLVVIFTHRAKLILQRS